MDPDKDAGSTGIGLDEHGRPETPPVADETTMLLAYLDYHRATFAWKCRGLGPEGLGARTAASTMTLGGMMKHLALVEDGWFSHALLGHDYSPPWDLVDWEADPDWEWRTAAADSPARHTGHADLLREAVDGETGE